MTFVAGQKIRASDLNAGLPLLARVASDVTTISNTSLINITGLVVALEANATYAVDGWIYYQSPSAADIKFNVTLPSGATCTMGAYGPPVTGAPFSATSPRVNYLDMGVFASSGGSYLHGGDTEFASVWASLRPAGVIVTSSTAGNAQFQFAQNTSTATNTIIKAGSWMRMARLA